MTTYDLSPLRAPTSPEPVQVPGLALCDLEAVLDKVMAAKSKEKEAAKAAPDDTVAAQVVVLCLFDVPSSPSAKSG